MILLRLLILNRCIFLSLSLCGLIFLGMVRLMIIRGCLLCWFWILCRVLKVRIGFIELVEEIMRLVDLNVVGRLLLRVRIFVFSFLVVGLIFLSIVLVDLIVWLMMVKFCSLCLIRVWVVRVVIMLELIRRVFFLVSLLSVLVVR